MTRIERELLEECRTIAAADGLRLADVLRDCHRFWTGGAGRALKPRGWTARAAAASRLLSRQITIDEHAAAGIDAEVIYLSDYRG